MLFYSWVAKIMDNTSKFLFKPSFVLDGTQISYHLPVYNPLRDKHLCHFFLNNLRIK